MSTIYKEGVLDLVQETLREWTGVNMADVRRLQDELIGIVDKFNQCIISESEAADFARKTSMEAIDYGIRAGEELSRLQEKPVQQSPETERFLSGLSEEKRDLLRSENEMFNQLPITALESLIAELRRLHDMALCVIGHIREYVEMPGYRERRIAFLSGKSLPEPAPATQPQEPTQATAEGPGLTDEEYLQKLDATGFIDKNTHITSMDVYNRAKPHSFVDVFDELARMTGSEKRARSIMFQHMPASKTTLNRHKPKRSLKT